MSRTQKKYTVKELIDLFPPDLGTRAIGEHFGVRRSTIGKWRTNPNMTISEYAADRYAISLGLHPAELWSTWIDDGINA
jgi:hypothetical protein